MEAAWATVRDEIAQGHQAYVVCPLVEESERVQAASASEELTRLAEGPLAGLRLGLLHGQLPAREKEAVMAEFRAGELAGAGGDDGYRGGRGRPQRNGHGDRGRRPLRHRPVAPAAGAGRAGGGPVRGATCSARHRRPTGKSGWPPSSGPTTVSSWPRWTSTSGERAPSSAPGKRASTT